jgi:general secretion pathway protein D
MKNIYKSKFKARGLSLCAVLASMPVVAQVVNEVQQTTIVTPTTQSFELGPTLDVLPFVLSDGYTINLTLIPSDVEFGGYSTPPVLPAFPTSIPVVQIPPILPVFTIRSVVATVNVWDNQTVVLGGLITSTVQTTKDEVPVIGDLPVIGRLFQSQSKSTVKQNLMIFVTALIVDPAGNRVHSDDELPFTQNNIPPQPPGGSHVTESVKTVSAQPAAASN